MRDVVSAIIIAAGLNVGLFVLLIVMGWIEPEERRAVVAPVRASKPPVPMPDVSNDHEPPRAA
jgi:hypothetical protein